MCTAVSGITKSDGTVYMPDVAAWDHSHKKIASRHNLPDGLIGDSYARWECSPANGDYQSDTDAWKFVLDEKRTPEWWSEDAAALEDRARREVKRYMAAANASGVAPGSSVSTTGYLAAASTTGYRAAASTTGEGAAASTTGEGAAASTTGYRAAASTTGDGAAASTTGHLAAASTTGYLAAASTTGDGAAASTTGNLAAASTTGEGAAASTTGDESVSVNVGLNGRVRSGERGALVCAERAQNWSLISWAIGIVGKDGIRAHQWYRAEAGKLIEADDEITREADRVLAERAKRAKQ